jgi:hypothetical protein
LEYVIAQVDGDYLKSIELQDYCMTCLHACGDLSVNMIKTFVMAEQCKVLINIGCCYNLLSDGENGFPLSKCSKETMKEARLPRAMKHLACQHLELFNDDSYDIEQTFNRNYFRCLFHLVLCETGICDPNSTAPVIGALKQRDCTDFVKYCTTASRKLGCHVDVALCKRYDEEFRYRRVQIDLMFTCRTMMSGILEAIIIMDRLIYLYEESCANVSLLKIFDASVSPRNIAIIATKDEKYE